MLDAVKTGCRAVREVVAQVSCSVNPGPYHLAAFSVAADVMKLPAGEALRFDGGASWKTPVALAPIS